MQLSGLRAGTARTGATLSKRPTGVNGSLSFLAQSSQSISICDNYSYRSHRAEIHKSRPRMNMRQSSSKNPCFSRNCGKTRTPTQDEANAEHGTVTHCKTSLYDRTPDSSGSLRPPSPIHWLLGLMRGPTCPRFAPTARRRALAATPCDCQTSPQHRACLLCITGQQRQADLLLALVRSCMASTASA